MTEEEFEAELKALMIRAKQGGLDTETIGAIMEHLTAYGPGVEEESE